MTAHLLQIALGPVQELIERARRTRDLWFGSMLLSEISKAAARAVRESRGKLIFPADDADLTQDRELRIANVIVAELPPDRIPGDVAKQAKTAVTRYWTDRFAWPVYDEFRAVIRKNIWDGQVNDVFEFYAAWVPFTADNYAQQRRRLAKLLAGRKSCRDFLPAEGKGREGLPKSSLDGLRETVLKKDEKDDPWPQRTRRRLRVRPGEQLDVLGLVKRTASDDSTQRVAHRHYPSVSRIAADPWLRGIAATEPGRQRLKALLEVCSQLCGEGLLNRVDRTLYPQYEVFPFEGSAVYRNRIPELEEALERDEHTELFDRLRTTLASVERYAGDAGLGAEPGPYAAVIVADGDRMGAAISGLQSPKEHQQFSRELATFAAEAAIVVAKHKGVLVYSGGDDVLAFAPLDQALACARALHSSFAATMRAALADVPLEKPTLSVGIAVGHFLESLEDLLGYGRAAEKHAKGDDRNGLAVHLHKRGGAPVRVRERWTGDLDSRLAEEAGWFLHGAVSSRTPYELDRLAGVYDDWPDDSGGEAVRRDALRVIDRKRPRGTDNQMDQIRAALESRVVTADDLRRLTAEMLIARHLAVALRQSGTRRPS